MLRAILTSDTHYGFSTRTHEIHEEFWEKVARDVRDRGIDILIHAGDIASHRQDQLYRSLAMMRRALPELPIVVVFGNHDYWETDRYRIREIGTWKKLRARQREELRNLGIWHADEGKIIGDVQILGFDGWYHHPNPPTNDLDRILSPWVEGQSVHEYFSRKAHQDLEKLLAVRSAARATVCVTHFPSFTDDPLYADYGANPLYHPLLIEKFDALCVGHSHHRVERREGRCQVLNAGSDYDEPRSLVFEV